MVKELSNIDGEMIAKSKHIRMLIYEERNGFWISKVIRAQLDHNYTVPHTVVLVLTSDNRKRQPRWWYEDKTISLYFIDFGTNMSYMLAASLTFWSRGIVLSQKSLLGFQKCYDHLKCQYICMCCIYHMFAYKIMIPPL